MEYVQLVLNMIDFETIKQLDMKIKGPGLGLAAFFLLQSFRSIFSFSPINLVMNFVYAIIVVVVLSNWGFVIQQMIFSTMGQEQQIQPPQNTSDTL